MADFKFSIIITAYNVEGSIEKTIRSIINQSLNFDKHIQIILINDGSKDNTKEICEKYSSLYPENIKYIYKDYGGRGISQKLGLKYAKGKYVSFLNAEDNYSRNTLISVLDLFEKHDEINVISIKSKFYNDLINETIIKSKYGQTQIHNLLKTPEFFQPQAKTCFFKKSSLENIEFPKDYNLSDEILMVNKILLDNPKLGVCSNCEYDITIPQNKKSLLNIIPNPKDPKNDKNYPLNDLLELSLEKYERIPEFIQYTILHYFNEVILNESINDKLNKKEIRHINERIKEILKYIDEENILSNYQIDIKIKAFLLYLKNDYSYSEDNQIKLNKYLKLDTVYIDIYEIIDDKLYILANINSINQNESVNVYVNNIKIESSTVEFPQREKYYLNERYLSNHTFEFSLPLDENKEYKLKFKTSDGQKLHIDFSRPCNFSKVVGYAKTKKYLSCLENDKIIISKKKTTTWLKKEIKTLAHMLIHRVSGFETAIPIRIAYMILYPFLKNKRIWFYMDFPTIADDNGMHLFKYSIKQDDKDIKKYFIVDKNTPYYEKMKKIGPTIAYHSLKHRILGLFTEKIITSHPDNNYIYAFWGHYPNFAGLLKSSTIFLQHGITLNNISSWLNKYDKNLDFLLTASKKEYDSLFKYYYHYDEKIIQLLGFPRFDNLTDDKTKTILLMPSWRRYLTNENKYTISNSSYFKTYNALINNEKLIQKLKENNFKIIFRPHPHVYDFIDLFDENEYVTIDHERGSYQDLFKKGALLVTDYSSVSFDFAYLKKPVLYYHYGEDYHFNLEESYFDYETMGFGEVCRSEDELVEIIGEYMENDCKMKDKHVKNVEDYFLFTDKNNCMRVHEAIKKIPPRE